MTTIFSKIIAGELPGFIPYQTENVAVLITLEGHPIIVPKYPYKDLYELPESIASEIMITAVKLANALQKATNCEGINLVQSNGAVAGQEVFHFHLHLKPRFTNDDIRFSWNTETRSDEERSELCKKIKEIL